MKARNGLHVLQSEWASIVFADQPVEHEREGDFRRARVFSILEKFVNEVRPVGVKVLEDVEVDLAPIGIQAVDELAASLNQSLEVCTVMLSACHLTLHYEVTNFATKPSRVAFSI
jgi:hypothetical protein